MINVGNCITSGEMHCPLNSLALECTPRLICACEEGIQPPLCSGKLLASVNRYFTEISKWPF